MAEQTNTITLEAFQRIIQAIIALDNKEDRFAQDMDRYLDGNFVSKFASEEMAEIIRGVESCFAYGWPKEPTISWWLWDSPNQGKDIQYSYIQHKDGTKYSVETIPLLFEYLTTGKTRVTL